MSSHASPSPRSSSPLSELPSRSPSPVHMICNSRSCPCPSTSSRQRRHRPQHLDASGYPTPPSSQNSVPGTPRDTDDSATEQDGPAIKRRRLNSMGPRETRRISLDYADEALQQQENIERLIKGLKTKRKIVVVAGAGISVSAGIPDFRSSDGLFKSLKAEHKLKGSGKSLFDADVYRDDNSTTSFHAMVRNLSKSTKSASATPFHHLLARLAREGRLLRLYTQNVDGIDTALEPLKTQVPLPRKGPWPKTVQLHGGLDKMVCIKCGKLSEFDPDLFDGPVPPECGQCVEVDKLRTQVAGKRSHGVGKLRPRMVLYNEPNPDDEAIGCVAKADMRRRPDAIIVVGTSMKIPGVRRIVREMCNIVRDHRDGLSVWINNDPEPSGVEFKDAWDIIVRGKSDDIAKLADLGHWDDPECSIESVSDTEIKVAREQGQPRVVVDSSGSFSHDALHLPTPEMTDAERATPQAETCAGIHRTKNAASSGKPIRHILNSSAIADGKPKAKPRQRKVSSKVKPKGAIRATAADKSSQTQIDQTFKQSKTTIRLNMGAKGAVQGKENLPPTKALGKADPPSTPTKSTFQNKHGTPAKASPLKFPNLKPPAAPAVVA